MKKKRNKVSIMKDLTHIVCYSNGVQSASVAIAIVEKYGKDNCILLNHGINPRYEDKSVTEFGLSIAKYLNIKITYANHNNAKTISNIPSQFKVCEDAGTFLNPKNRQILCTNRLKTAPFMKWLKENEYNNTNSIIYYGFTIDETKREDRRQTIMCSMGFETVYPLIRLGVPSDYYKKTGTETPKHYKVFKHGNCWGCLKAGKQHWYAVYCLRPEVFNRSKLAEKRIGYSIIRSGFMKDFEPMFEAMKNAGIEPTEHIKPQTFWANTRKILNNK